MNYKQTCQLLGFDAASKFVRLTRSGAIDFTIGKPEEIRALAVAAMRNGLKLSLKFDRLVRQRGWTLAQAETR
jgi:hypothetical protein